MASGSEKERIAVIPIEEEIKKSYIDYSMSVIVGRALPDVRDGLKPAHRRVLYAMFREGLLSNRKHSKCAGVVGEVLKKYHPHGDASVYDTLVRMAQNWNLRYPLVDGQGNFGSIDGDNAAAYRYTESRMMKIAEEMMADIDKNTVGFSPNFDESTVEPTVLPSRIPNLLINGSSGIAVGMATNIPPHNLIEIATALQKMIDVPDLSIEELLQIVTGPDFPTGGTIYGFNEIRRAYLTGRGLIKLRAKADIEVTETGKEVIIVKEIPYTVNKSSLVEKIAALINEKRITGISDLRDESDKDGLRIVVEIKRGEIAQVILNQLYKHTQLQTTFGTILLSLDHGRPRVMNLKQMLQCYLEHRREVIVRRTNFDLTNAQNRAHILEGYKIAVANLDQIVRIIRSAKDRNSAKSALMDQFKFSDKQTNAILELRLYQLTGLEISKIEEEYFSVTQKIEYYQKVLGDESIVNQIIRDDLEEVKGKYGDERRTNIVPDTSELSMEDLIADEACVITISHTGYIKRSPMDYYRQQRRGGKGLAGMGTKEEDFVKHLFHASAHDCLLFFTEKGRLYWLKVYEIPQVGRIAKGTAIVNLLQINQEERISTLIRVRDFDQDLSIIKATAKGVVKKTPLSGYRNIRKGGIIAINIDEDDKLVSVKLTEGKSDILLATKEGLSIRFSETNVRNTGRVTRGVRGISLRGNDRLVLMEVVEEDATLLIVTENGFGKRTEYSAYRTQHRGGKGVITIKANERNGKVVGGGSVIDGEEIMMITSSGKMIRTAVSGISVIGRNTQGVNLITLHKTDKVVDMCRVIESEEDPEKNEEEISDLNGEESIPEEE
ncbi:MAG: DNA gyrase subunit A [Candidatus Theseobacter exili]|nr:DNA gyrase subunit A [Candidatus Theseobacter exili]